MGARGASRLGASVVCGYGYACRLGAGTNNNGVVDVCVIPYLQQAFTYNGELQGGQGDDKADSTSKSLVDVPG